MRRTLEWKSDEFGRALIPGAHDGRLLRYCYSEEQQSLEIKLASPTGRRVEVELQGVVEVNFRDLCNGSITSSLFLWNVRLLPEGTWSAPNSGWGLLFGSRYASADVREVAARIGLRYPKAHFVQLECSYGGALAAVCQKVALYSDEP